MVKMIHERHNNTNTYNVYDRLAKDYFRIMDCNWHYIWLLRNDGYYYDKWDYAEEKYLVHMNRLDKNYKKLYRESRKWVAHVYNQRKINKNRSYYNIKYNNNKVIYYTHMMKRGFKI